MSIISQQSSMKKNRKILPSILYRVLPLAGVALVLIWIATRTMANRAVRTEIEERVSSELTHSAREISDRLINLAAITKGLAANDLVINGLIDSTARANYLPLFFHSLRIPGPDGVQIAMTDYKGRFIVSNTGEEVSYEDAPWFKRAMEGNGLFRISAKGILIAEPIKYSGGVEGVLGVAYGPAEVSDILQISSPTAAFIITDAKGGVCFSSHKALAESARTHNSASLPGHIYREMAIPDFPGLLMTCLIKEKAAHATLTRLDAFLLAAMILDFFALVFGVYFSARFAVGPLNLLVQKIDEIRRTGDLTQQVPETGPAEFRMLSRSFNEMNESLSSSTTSIEALNMEVAERREAEKALRESERSLREQEEHLEDLVEERTRELKAARNELINRAMEAGRAQLSAMVLHNIGNAITPVRVQIEEMMMTGELEQLFDYMEKCYMDLDENVDDLRRYVKEDPRGKQVFGYMKTLIDSLKDQGDRKKGMVAKMDSAVSYISEILTLQQSYAANEEETKEMTDLNLLMEDAIRMQSGALEKRGIGINKALDPGLPKLLIDKNRLIQVIVNIVKNGYEAIDASGKSENFMTFHSFSKDGRLGFEITDSGIGIEPGQEEEIFEFGKSSKGSSGFGLSYCKMFVEANKGTFEIKSPGKGKGATVRVVFEKGLTQSRKARKEKQ